MSSKAKSKEKKVVQEIPLEQLVIGSAVYETRLTQKFKNRKYWLRPDVRLVDAIIPGTIQRIMAHEGDEVSAGTPLLILEAMKMRNEIVAPLQGIIKKIHVSEGDHVSKSQLLVEFK